MNDQVTIAINGGTRAARVEVRRPSGFAWRGDVLDVHEHTGTTWLWALPQLLVWPRDRGPVTWLFAGRGDGRQPRDWAGDLWGSTSAGTS